MTVQFEKIPQALRDRQQWVLWYLGKSDEAGKRPKIPLVRKSAQTLTASEWSKHADRWWSFEHAAEILKSGKRPSVVSPHSKYTVSLIGMGIALRHDVNPPGQILVAFDVDDHTPNHRLNLVRDGKIHNPSARDLVKRLDSYCEITPSGFGFRVLCLVSQLPPGIGTAVTEGKYHHNLNCEIFVGNKFITVTGHHAEGTPTEIKLAPLDSVVANFTFARSSATPNGGMGTAQRVTNGRHNFLKRMAAKFVKAHWITDRDLLFKYLQYLKDTWCDEPGTLPDREIEDITDWALANCAPDALWQGNDSYLASSLLASDPRYAAGWRGDLTGFNGEWAGAYNYVTDKLLRACGNDVDQTTRIYQSSHLYKIVESQIPEHLKNAVVGGRS